MVEKVVPSTLSCSGRTGLSERVVGLVQEVVNFALSALQPGTVRWVYGT